MSPDTKRSIVRFWNWIGNNFLEVERLLQPSSDQSFSMQLSRALHAVHSGLHWEIGESQRGGYQFVVSPGGHRDLVPIADAIVAYSPSISGWSFIACKPPKPWNRRLLIRSGNENLEFEIDAWGYRLIEYNDGEFYDIELIPDQMISLQEDERDGLGTIIVENILGERAVMEKIGAIEVRSFRGRKPSEISELKFLYDQFSELTKEY